MEKQFIIRVQCEEYWTSVKVTAPNGKFQLIENEVEGDVVKVDDVTLSFNPYQYVAQVEEVTPNGNEVIFVKKFDEDGE